MAWRGQLTILGVLCVAGLGCGGDNAAASVGGNETACDPFAPHMQPITLTTLLGAGKDANGTIYAADDGGPDQGRVYVSKGKQLVRQRVAGVTMGDGVYVFEVQDHDPAFVLEIEGDYPKFVHIGVLIGSLGDRKVFTIGKEGEELTVVPESDVKALTLRNLPGDVLVEYADRLKDGRLLVVTRPEDDWTDKDVRVFLGPKNGIIERRVKEFSRGSDTHITFDLEGGDVEALYPLSFSVDAGPMPGTPTLTIAGKSQDLEALDGRPSGAHYQCLAQH
jgi:hypothetical protein